MVTFDEVISTNLGGNGVVNVAGNILNIIVMVFVVLIFAALVYYLMRYLSYQTNVEIYEKKGKEIVHIGDDKVRRKKRDGVSYMVFLKNKDPLFKDRSFPKSDFLYRKKFFGTKLKLLIVDDELVPFKISLDDNNNLNSDAFSTAQKIDYLQRTKGYHDKYVNKDIRAQNIQLIIQVAFIGALLFGFFVIWQSNVATAESNAALSSATQALANAITAQGTLPSSPG